MDEAVGQGAGHAGRHRAVTFAIAGGEHGPVLRQAVVAQGAVEHQLVAGGLDQRRGGVQLVEEQDAGAVLGQKSRGGACPYFCVRGITNAKERIMLSRAKKVSRDVAKLPSVPKELVAHFLTGPMNGEAIETAGIAFKKALIEAALNAELGHHLGYEAGADRPDDVTNHRNGGTSKTVLTGDGKV